MEPHDFDEFDEHKEGHRDASTYINETTSQLSLLPKVDIIERVGNIKIKIADDIKYDQNYVKFLLETHNKLDEEIKMHTK